VARISQNSAARRPAPAPKPTRNDFVGKAGRGGKPTGGTHTTLIKGASIPTPIEKGMRRA
jgi:hypothetical protein